jgi:hypothetical protein
MSWTPQDHPTSFEYVQKLKTWGDLCAYTLPCAPKLGAEAVYKSTTAAYDGTSPDKVTYAALDDTIYLRLMTAFEQWLREIGVWDKPIPNHNLLRINEAVEAYITNIILNERDVSTFDSQIIGILQSLILSLQDVANPALAKAVGKPGMKVGVTITAAQPRKIDSCQGDSDLSLRLSRLDGNKLGESPIISTAVLEEKFISILAQHWATLSAGGRVDSSFRSRGAAAIVIKVSSHHIITFANELNFSLAWPSASQLGGSICQVWCNSE